MRHGSDSEIEAERRANLAKSFGAVLLSSDMWGWYRGLVSEKLRACYEELAKAQTPEKLYRLQGEIKGLRAAVGLPEWEWDKVRPRKGNGDAEDEEGQDEGPEFEPIDDYIPIGL